MVLSACSIAAGLTAVAAWLFYDTVFGILWFPVFAWISFSVLKRVFQERRRRLFLLDLRELLLVLSGALAAGLSLENACRRAERELERMLSPKSLLLAELRKVNRKTTLRMSADQAFLEWTTRFPYEEVQSFVQMLHLSRRLGGNEAARVQKAADRIGARIDLEEEIHVMLTEKRLELTVMSVMPAAVLAYVRFGAPEYLSSVYGNVRGILFMSGCLAAYLGSVLLGIHLSRIEV